MKEREAKVTISGSTRDIIPGMRIFSEGGQATVMSVLDNCNIVIEYDKPKRIPIKCVCGASHE